MKKITQLLSFYLILLSGLINAQNLNISFESSEGFTLGEINGQNSWIANPNYSNLVNIVDTQFTDGTSSLFFSGDPNGPIPNNSITGAGISNLNFTDVTFTADIFVESGLGLNPSEFNIILQSPSLNALTSRVVFFNGTIILVDSIPTPQFVTAGNFIPDTWFELKIVHDFTNGTIEYYIDDSLFYTGNVVNGTTIEEMLLFSSFNQTGFYIDNINFTSNTMSAEEFTAAEIKIYPNPTSDILYLEKNTTHEIASVQIFDSTGREYEAMLGEDYSINVENLPTGIYILNLKTYSGTESIKFVKN
jgi:hypothetical protein